MKLANPLVLAEVLDGLQYALDVAHLDYAQVLEVAPPQGEQLLAANIVLEKTVHVLGQLHCLQPGDHLVDAPVVGRLAGVVQRWLKGLLAGGGART